MDHGEAGKILVVCLVVWCGAALRRTGGAHNERKRDRDLKKRDKLNSAALMHDTRFIPLRWLITAARAVQATVENRQYKRARKGPFLKRSSRKF